MHPSEQETIRGKGAPINLDYRCFRNYINLNRFEEDEPSSKQKAPDAKKDSELK